MACLNRVMLIGNVGKEPEIRSLNNGDRVASFSLGLTETWKDRDGQKKERTEWANVVCFNDGLVKVIESYVKKGHKLYVEGQMQTRSWEKDRVKRYSTEVVLTKFDGKLVLLSSRERSDADEGQDFRGSRSGGVAGGGGGEFRPDLDDEIPFIVPGDL